MKRAWFIAFGVAVMPVQAQLAPAPAPPAQKLASTNPDGSIEALDGFVELRAIKVVEGLDAESKERVRRGAREWLLDVQQQVIDNQDFIAEIEPLDGTPGFFDSIDLKDPKFFEKAAVFAKQLNSAGTLVNTLVSRRALSAQVAQTVQREVYNYDMALLRQVTGGGSDINASTRHQYKVAFRDAMGMHHSLLDRAESRIDDVVASLGAEMAKSLEPQVALIKAAGGKAEKRAAVGALLQRLSLAQRRTVLMKVRDLVPITDPFSFV